MKNAEQSLVLDVRDLKVALPKSADRAHAVDGINLQIRRNEIVCVVGESGSGKSVVAQTVMGLNPPSLAVDGGSIFFEGEDILAMTEKRRRALRGARLSMIFQEPMTALNPLMKVGRQITEVLRVHTDLSPSERRAKAIAMMEEVHLPDPVSMFERYPHELSGGQRQRIMIASALVLEPSLLIADEPTTALDVTTQAQILRLIREIQQKRGTAVMFITHDFGVVSDIADRIAVMEKGRLVEFGEARRILTEPREDYTRMLLDAVPGMQPKPSPAATVQRAVVLSTKNVTKTYGATSLFRKQKEIRALDEVTLEIRKGETLGVVGESGSGKSTLARCITRLIAPTGGEIWLGDVEIGKLKGSQLRDQRRRFQIVFQDPYRSLNPRTSVGKSIVECPMNFGVGRSDAWKRAGDLLELVGLRRESLDRYPYEFSGGQRQRICIARALAVNPELLIADEAVSALDVSVQAQVLALLEDIRDRFDLAMLFITHDLRVAAQICDRLVVMHRGKVVESGKTVDIFANPKHSYTQTLLKSAPGAQIGQVKHG